MLKEWIGVMQTRTPAANSSWRREMSIEAVRVGPLPETAMPNPPGVLIPEFSEDNSPRETTTPQSGGDLLHITADISPNSPVTTQHPLFASLGLHLQPRKQDLLNNSTQDPQDEIFRTDATALESDILQPNATPERWLSKQPLSPSGTLESLTSQVDRKPFHVGQNSQKRSLAAVSSPNFMKRSSLRSGGWVTEQTASLPTASTSSEEGALTRV
jgi:hypothetical protein